MSNVPAVEGLRAPMGQFVNVKRYPPADYRGVSAPNADTHYSLAWVDVGSEPMVFSHPDMGNRFFLFPMYSLWMPVIDSVGTRTGEPVPVGVPYGSRARLILLYLQSEAMRTGSREVILGKSLRNWLLRMGIPQGGNSILGVREQAERISRCRLTFHVSRGGRTGLVNQNIVDTAIFLENDGTMGQGSLFVETARLSEGFFEHLRKHPVPLEDAAIRAINNNSMALDVYAWLAYRLHVLPSPRPITWKALKGQFGAGYGRQDNFIRKFLDSLRLALAVYPAARVDVSDPGLVLHPSRPPVAPKQLALR
jgi:hypothetical protein